MGKGFQMTFANGLTVSVQWGYGNYCENNMRHDSMKTEAWAIDLKSKDAEVAVFDRDGKWRTRDFFADIGDDVVGHLSADEVANLIADVCGRAN